MSDEVITRDSRSGRLLLMFYDALRMRPDADGVTLDDLHDMRRYFSEDFPSGFLHATLDHLEELELIKERPIRADYANQPGYVLRRRGLDLAESWLEKSTGASVSDSVLASDYINADVIPAADRFVALDHNSQEHIAAVSALEDVENGVANSNELRVSADDRLAVLSEIRGLKALLTGPTVRVRALWDATRDKAVLGWLGKESASGTIKELAAIAIRSILRLLGLG